MYVAGRRGDRPWRLGIRDPRGPADKSFAMLDLTDGTFSTSGDYERFFIEGRPPLSPHPRSDAWASPRAAAAA